MTSQDQRADAGARTTTQDQRVEGGARTSTQDQRAETMESTESTAASGDLADSSEGSGPVQTANSTAEPGAAAEARDMSDAPSDSSTDTALFADRDLRGLRLRWADVQSGFVDDPRECVQKADGLVADVVDQLTGGFAEARSRLEEQWARGEEVSTEDLRLALKRYRDFFERLLAV